MLSTKDFITEMVPLAKSLAVENSSHRELIRAIATGSDWYSHYYRTCELPCGCIYRTFSVSIQDRHVYTLILIFCTTLIMLVTALVNPTDLSSSLIKSISNYDRSDCSLSTLHYSYFGCHNVFLVQNLPENQQL